MKLNDLMPNVGAKSKRKRIGHGPSAGQGKTSGRGTKGQGSRSGGSVRLYHQGGNLPFYRHLPFMRGQGFTPPNRVQYSEVNLGQLAIFPAGSEITLATLVEADLVRKPALPVVLLGEGEVTVPLTVRVQRVTKSAKAKIEAAGGSVETIQ
jgi:large subunit ribosomal protein L15